MAIHQSAVVDPGASIGKNVSIGPFTIIEAGVKLGDGCQIGSHCILGYANPQEQIEELRIGDGALVRSHSVLYGGSALGANLVTGHHVTIREGTTAGVGLQVGTLSDIQGDCVIGNHVRLHSNVFIAKGSSVGDFVWLFPYVVLTNDPHPPSSVAIGVCVERFAAIATMSVILPGVKVGEGSLVAAHALVRKDVPSGMVVGGSPARVLGEASSIVLQDGTGRSAYPWIRHFRRGYPPDVVEEWKALHS